MDRRNLPVVAAILLLVGLASIFFLRNQGTLSGDDSQQFAFVQALYFKFLNGGFFSTLKACYLERAPRPVLYPVFALIPLVLTGGSVLASIAWTNLFFYAVFLTCIALLLRRFLPHWEAAIGTIVVGTLPWVLFGALHFYGEIYLLAFAALSALLMLRSRAWLAGIALGLAGCCRPVETVLFMGVPLILDFMIRRRRRSLLAEWGWVGTSLAGSLALLTAAILSDRNSYVSWLPLYFLYQGILCVFYRRCSKAEFRDRHLFPVLVVSQWIVIAWFATGFQDLMGWLIFTAHVHYPYWEKIMSEWRALHPHASYPLFVFSDLGGIPLLLLLLASLIGIRKRLRPLSVLLVAPVLFMGLQVNRGNWDVRYFLIAFVSIVLTLLVSALESALPWRPWRVAALIALAGLQLGYAGERVYSKQYENLALDGLFRGPRDSLSPWIQEEPGRIVPRAITSALQPTANAPIGILVLRTWSDDDRDDLNWAHFLNLFTGDERLPLSFVGNWSEFFDLRSEILAYQASSSRYLLVHDNGLELSPADLRNSRVARLALKARRSGDPSFPKARLEIPWTSKDGHSTKVLLFETQPLLKYLSTRDQG